MKAKRCQPMESDMQRYRLIFLDGPVSKSHCWVHNRRCVAVYRSVPRVIQSCSSRTEWPSKMKAKGCSKTTAKIKPYNPRTAKTSTAPWQKPEISPRSKLFFSVTDRMFTSITFPRKHTSFSYNFVTCFGCEVLKAI